MDSSFVFKLLVWEEDSADARAIWSAWHRARETIIAPTLLVYEATSSLRSAAYRGRVSAEDAVAGLDAFFDLPIGLCSGQSLHVQALRLANKMHLGAAYDAHYLALCQEVECPVWTADRRMYRAAEDLSIPAHLLAPSPA